MRPTEKRSGSGEVNIQHENCLMLASQEDFKANAGGELNHQTWKQTPIRPR